MPRCWTCAPTPCVNRGDEISLKNVCFLHLDVTTTCLMLRVCRIYISLLKEHFLSTLSEIFVILEQGFRASNTLWSKYSDKFETTIDVGQTWISGKYICEPFSFCVRT